MRLAANVDLDGSNIEFVSHFVVSVMQLSHSEMATIVL
jgi:hypothetical protein